MKLATLCYIKHNGKTLMIHRIKQKGDMHMGKWNGLGGKVKPGETPEECVIREVKEESGLKIKSQKLKGFITFPAFDNIDDWYVFVFTVNEFTGRLSETKEGDLEWIKDTELLRLNLWEGDYIFLPWFEKKTFFSAKFVYNRGKLKSHSAVFY